MSDAAAAGAGWLERAISTVNQFEVLLCTVPLSSPLSLVKDVQISAFSVRLPKIRQVAIFPPIRSKIVCFFVPGKVRGLSPTTYSYDTGKNVVGSHLTVNVVGPSPYKWTSVLVRPPKVGATHGMGG